ncbi:MAG TPA: hypothetical protein VGG19_15250 [Tepidisphaeraceae bacterium]|jgi:photosystem II stability/assembly factor-like uncharacterized protein
MHSRRGRKFRNQRYGIERLETRWLLASAAYTWQNAAIGAGGFVDGIFFDPNNQNTIYARTDIGGLYKTTDGGQNWQQLLDFVGNSTTTSGNGTQEQEIGVLAFAIDPENSNNLYADVGEYSGTNGAVFYSTNAGATWSQTNLSFYVGGNSNGRGDGEQIAVDPNDSNIIFLGSNANGLWESTNAGHSFTQITGGSTGLTSTLSTTFVLFDPTSSTPGSPSQKIYLGIDSTSSSAGTNLYQSTNGGASFTKLTGTGTLPNKWIPGHAVISGTILYIAYANAEAPSGNITTGGVFRFAPGTTASNGMWANIAPQTPGGSNPTFGYDGIAADPNNPGTIVVTSFDRYSGPDQIWRTINATATTPTWVAMYSTTGAQNFGFGGYDPTRNTSNAPWIAAFGDGIGNWAAAVAIDPFNSAHLMYGTGQGIWATNNATSATTLTAANSWYFPDNGIEFTAVTKLIATQTGVPLFSALGDINGFAHTTLTSSPAAGGIEATITNGGLGTLNSIDFAQSNPNFEAVVGQNGTGGAYTTNDGASWTAFAANPASALGGAVAVSADGATLLWSPAGETPYYSTNDGATWTASSVPSGTLTGGTVVADRVNANQFYYWTENSSDNSWQLYLSTDGGKTFTSDGSALGIGNATLIADPSQQGGLYLSTYIGLYHSTNSGASFAQNSVIGYNLVSSVALGAAAPGRSNLAIYIYGDINNFTGVYRSDDGGTTWILLNDVSHQWGGLIDTMAADPNVFGRVYLGINGRGIIIGNPANTLPSGWSDSDIGIPGNPGWATNSLNLSTGTTINQWTIVGGGAGLANSSDQFNFASESITGDGFVIAQLTSLTDADGSASTPQAGVMFRASTDAGDPFVAVLQGTNNQITFEYRSTSAGSITSTPVGNIPLGSEYLELTRTGNIFTAYISSDSIHWTQIGSPITIVAMPTTANVGLAATANYNPQLTAATFSNIAVGNLPAAQLAGNQLTYAFNANVSAFLSQGSLSITPTVGGSAISPTSYAYNTATNTAEFTLPSSIPAGIYQATLLNQNFTFLIVPDSSTFILPGNSQTYTVQQLFLGASATLDIGSNTLAVQYTGSSPINSIAAAISSGYNAGQWNGAGIISSDAQADSSATTGIGYYDNGSTIVIRDTWLGDANCDGTINADDLSLIMLGQAQHATHWQDGNVNYDTQVNADDWSKITYAIAYSQTQAFPAFSQAPISVDYLSQLLD